MSGGKSKVMAALVVGMVLGVTLAALVAWYVVNRNTAEFTNKEKAKQVEPQTVLPASAPVVASPAASAASSSTLRQFEFYHVLTDKSDRAPQKSPSRSKEPAPPGSQPEIGGKGLYYVQAGSFQNMQDAEKLKARLAFSGFEASIQTTAIPDKGVWHRVRLGPYDNTEANKTIAALKQNGITATQVHAAK